MASGPFNDYFTQLCKLSPVAQLDARSAWRADGHGYNPWVRQHSFMEIGHEIISTAIPFLLLIQVGQLSVTGKWMCT